MALLAWAALAHAAPPVAEAAAPVPLARETTGAHSAATLESGSSSVRMTGACMLPLPCAGHTTWRSGTFTVYATERAELEARWVSTCRGCGTMRVSVPGIASAVGQSPLRIDLGGVSAGTYEVRVSFVDGVLGEASQHVEWTVT